VKITKENILTHHDSHPLTLNLYLTKHFGPEWWEWEPETLTSAISREFNKTCSENTWNKIQAVRTVHVAPGLVFDEWECFLPVITALNNVIPDFNVLQFPSPARLYNGVGIIKAIDSEETFSDEIQRFVASCLLHESIIYAPGDLSFCQTFLNRPYYVCTNCGNKEELIIDHDGYCDNCQKEYYSKIRGELRKGAKKTTYIQYESDPTEVRKKFQKASRDWDKFLPDPDSEIDCMVCKIAAALDYKIDRDQRFIAQKRGLNL
jgi:hypothetical protein